MLALLAAAAAALPQSPALQAVGGLAGCWKAPGSVRGQATDSAALGQWRLGGRYLLLQLKSRAPQKPYAAAIFFGEGQQPLSIRSYWMDTFGGAFSIVGDGKADAGGFSVDYHYPDSVYVNRFERRGDGWRWTIMEQAAGKPPTLFAEYALSPTACGATKFEF